MARAYHETGFLRFSRRERERVIAALLLSLVAHLGVWAAYEAGQKTGLWAKLHPPQWLRPAAKLHSVNDNYFSPSATTIIPHIASRWRLPHFDLG